MDLLTVGNKIVDGFNAVGTAVAKVKDWHPISYSTVTPLPPIATAATVVLAASQAFNAIMYGYNFYDSKDDSRLLLKIMQDDCGGLSKMTSKIEGCYREYIVDAFHRYRGALEKMYFDRVQECFSKRPELECPIWRRWEIDVFTKDAN